MKLSHSSINKYNECPQAYNLRYNARLVGLTKGSALYFGSAMDEALNTLVLTRNLKAAKRSFLKTWLKQKNNLQVPTRIAKSIHVIYFNGDFNGEILTSRDLSRLDHYAHVLYGAPVDGMELFNQIIVAKKGSGWDSIKNRERSFYNYCMWMSMKQKGLMMVEAYFTDVLPQIKEVLSVQMATKITNGETDSVEGFIDLVVRWKDGSVIILDNKTASTLYEEDKARTSQQLALYKITLDEFYNDPSHSWKHKIDKVGFVVLGKKFKKPRGQQQKVPVQILIDDISTNVEDQIINIVNETNTAIQAGHFPENRKSCVTFFGKCDYFDLCHYGHKSKVFQLPPK